MASGPRIDERYIWNIRPNWTNYGNSGPTSLKWPQKVNMPLVRPKQVVLE